MIFTIVQLRFIYFIFVLSARGWLGVFTVYNYSSVVCVAVGTNKQEYTGRMDPERRS